MSYRNNRNKKITGAVILLTIAIYLNLHTVISADVMNFPFGKHFPYSLSN
jgi:hypothetical protein